MFSMNKTIFITKRSERLVDICRHYSIVLSNGHSFRIKLNKTTINCKPIDCNRKPNVRQLFGFPFKSPISTSKVRKYSERRLLGYSKEQLFQVVSRVEDYHLFVPACVKSEVKERHKTYLCAELEIGIPPLIWERYTSRVTLSRPDRVIAKCIDGKLFKHLETHWKFGDGLADNKQSCCLDFSVSFEFRSLVHSQLVHVFFDEMARQTVNAFLKRVEHLYGKQSLLFGSNPLTHKT